MVLQHARSSFHIPWNKVEASRIVATTGAIALNIAILMLLLVPAARLLPQPDKPFIWYMPPEKVTPPPTPPPTTVPVTPATQPTARIPVVTPPAADAQPSEQIIDPMGTIPADPVVTTPAVITPPTTIASTEPIAGAHLEYLHAPPPKYTRELMMARAEGTVLLQVLVDVDGKPLEVKILKSSGIRQLDELARRTVLKWAFRPATRDGQPVQAIGNVPIDFTLQ
jgi:protein TonB